MDSHDPKETWPYAREMTALLPISVVPNCGGAYRKLPLDIKLSIPVL